MPAHFGHQVASSGLKYLGVRITKGTGSVFGESTTGRAVSSRFCRVVDIWRGPFEFDNLGERATAVGPFVTRPPSRGSLGCLIIAGSVRRLWSVHPTVHTFWRAGGRQTTHWGPKDQTTDPIGRINSWSNRNNPELVQSASRRESSMLLHRTWYLT